MSELTVSFNWAGLLDLVLKIVTSMAVAVITGVLIPFLQNKIQESKTLKEKALYASLVAGAEMLNPAAGSGRAKHSLVKSTIENQYNLDFNEMYLQEAVLRLNRSEPKPANSLPDNGDDPVDVHGF